MGCLDSVNFFPDAFLDDLDCFFGKFIELLVAQADRCSSNIARFCSLGKGVHRLLESIATPLPRLRLRGHYYILRLRASHVLDCRLISHGQVRIICALRRLLDLDLSAAMRGCVRSLIFTGFQLCDQALEFSQFLSFFLGT
jgi:hypothetical protein